MESKNYTQVLIDGKIYTLGGDEDEAYLQRTAGYVNDKNSVIRKLPGFTKQSADYQMVMIELNIADDYFKALNHAEAMEEMKNNLEKETYSLKHELISTQMKLEAVLKDLEERQRQLEELEDKNAGLERELKASLAAAKSSAAQALEARQNVNAAQALEAGQNVSAAQAAGTDASGAGLAVQTAHGTEGAAEGTAVPAAGNMARAVRAAGGEAQAKGASELSDEELAKKALQAARKAGSYRGGRR